jgi:hypothetical protein
MRDHRDGQDPTPVDITERIRQVRDRIPHMPPTVRRRQVSKAPRPPARGKAAKILRSQR